MNIPVQLALTIGQEMRNDALFKEIPGKGRHFDKNRIKALNLADRKLCYQALTAIEHAKLDDFNSESPPENLSKRVREVTKAVTGKLSIHETPSPVWYKRPFLWIARCIHSLVLWFKNTFLGRTSSSKLHNKVETYLNDYNRAQRRIALLTADEGLITKAKGKLNQCANEQKAFLKSFKILLEVHETLRLIDFIIEKNEESKAKGTENFRREIQDAWIVDKMNSDVIPLTHFKEVIVREVSEKTQEVREHLKDLLKAAKQEDQNDEDVLNLLEQAGKRVTEKMKEQFKTGNQHRIRVEIAHKHLCELKGELELLLKKYPE